MMIETNRLLIKPLSRDELSKHLLSPAELASDLGLTPSTSLTHEETREAILNDLLPNISDPKKNTLFYTMWIVIEKSKQAIVGGICFHGEPNSTGEVEIGYGTDEEYRNKGIMTETIAGIVQWLKLNDSVKSIIAETEPGNTSSIRVLEKNGFHIFKSNDNAVCLRHDLK
jgi:ribosomal-protein-alanine N-acetyltransferase